MELLHFVFQDAIHFFGALMLIWALGEAASSILASIFKPRK